MGGQVAKIIRSIHQEHSGNVPSQIYRLSETPLEVILAEARTLPFLAPAQIFRIREADKLTKQDLETLEAYLLHPSEASYLLFETTSLDKGTGLFELAKKYGEVTVLEPKEASTSVGILLEEKVRKAGKRLTRDALNLLLAKMGEEPSLLSSVIEQLITYAGDGPQITAPMVEQFSERIHYPDTFELTRALGSRNLQAALKTIHELLEEEGDLVGLLGLLHWQMRRLWLGRRLMDEKAPVAIIQRKCSISAKQLPFFMRELQRFPIEKLEEALEGLFQLDWSLKTGQVKGREALEAWIVKLVS